MICESKCKITKLMSYLLESIKFLRFLSLICC